MVGRRLLFPLSEVGVTQAGYLRPIRVLVASRDSRFLNLARFLLARHGFLVEATRKLSRLSECVDRQWAEVLVIDASGSAARAARTADLVQGADPDLAVVIVGDEAERSSTRGRTILEKWSLHALTAEIESAYISTGHGGVHLLAPRQDETPIHTR
jgi:hypothetical protein